MTPSARLRLACILATLAGSMLLVGSAGCRKDSDPRVYEDAYVWLRVPADWKYGPGEGGGGVMLAPQSWHGEPPEPAIIIQYRDTSSASVGSEQVLRALLATAVDAPKQTTRVIGGTTRTGYLFTTSVDGRSTTLEVFVVAGRSCLYVFALSHDAGFPQGQYQSVLDTVRLKR